MQKLLTVPLLLLLLGCPAATGYHVNLTVTVPPDVQAQLSSAGPGLLMGNLRTVVAELCDPTDVPFSVPITFFVAGHQCEKAGAEGMDQLFVVRLSVSDIAWFAANQPKLQCGHSRPITDIETLDAISQRATQEGWGPQSLPTVASAVGGSCDSAGNYTGTIVLKLTP